MSDLSRRPRRIWLRSFYGFNPQDEGYIGWTEEGPRDRMLGLIESGDLFMIYGAASAETNKSNRNRVLGFLQVEAQPITDHEKSSSAGLERKRTMGWERKWSFAIPVRRAWRVDESILLERVAPKTYRPEAGQAIAVWSPPLLPEEVDLALKIRVTEVSVYGEPALAHPPVEKVSLTQVFQPSKAFAASFGQRTSRYENGPTQMYLARFEGNYSALLGRAMSPSDKTVLIKIGVSNDIDRRSSELNAGLPPAGVGRWKIQLVSEPYEGHEGAEKAEDTFKIKAEKELESLGGEFFCGSWISAQLIFSAIPGVSRFGGSSKR